MPDELFNMGTYDDWPISPGRRHGDMRDTGDRNRHDDGDGGGRWLPAWIQTVLAVIAVIVSVVLAYSALDKRIALIEQQLNGQKEQLDVIIYQNGKR